MSRINRSAYISAPTGWPRNLIVEYAEHVLRDRGEVPAGRDVTIRLTDSEVNISDYTTTWRVNYAVPTECVRPARPQFRRLSLNSPTATGRA